MPLTDPEFVKAVRHLDPDQEYTDCNLSSRQAIIDSWSHPTDPFYTDQQLEDALVVVKDADKITRNIYKLKVGYAIFKDSNIDFTIGQDTYTFQANKDSRDLIHGAKTEFDALEANAIAQGGAGVEWADITDTKRLFTKAQFDAFSAKIAVRIQDGFENYMAQKLQLTSSGQLTEAHVQAIGMKLSDFE